MKIKPLLPLFLLLLAGCAGMTPPKPQSFDEHVAAARTVLTLTNDTATVLVNGEHISKPDGREVLERTRPAREAIDVAEQLRSEEKLTSAINLLKAAQQYLCRDLKDNPNCALLLQQGARL